jgi:NADH:ubiquinone oxidoreductase subunit 6 (subunit J)
VSDDRRLEPSPPTGHTAADEAVDPDKRLAKAIIDLLNYALLLFDAAGTLAWHTGIVRIDQFREMARGIFTTYIVPFELLGFLLLAALLGALYLAAREGAHR